MNHSTDQASSRRRFLKRTSVVAAASLLGVHHRPAAAEPPAEVSRIRFTRSPSICPDWRFLNELTKELKA